jgi:dihydrodipicolinate synthase/N-acetylneuraminate lyase
MMGTNAVLGGAQVLLVTPFDEEGELDERSLAALIEFAVDAGVQGVISLATTGEFFAMTPAEREEVMAVVVKQVRGRVTATFGVGDSSTRTAVALARAAEAQGADCIMLQPPWYYAHSAAAVDAHLLTVATAVRIPTMLYDGGGGSALLLPRCTDWLVSRP